MSDRIIIEVLDKLVYLDQKVILTIRSMYLRDLTVNLGYFVDYSKDDSNQLDSLDKNAVINMISFWYNETYNTYTISIVTDEQTFEGNVFKAELLTFLKAIREDQVLASTIDITKIF